MNISKAKSIGLVLSGGGVRGVAHIGLIKAMQEHGLQAQVVAGSSAGALVGALYANGNTVEEMLHFFKETPLFQYSFFAINKPGLIDTERYFHLFKKYFPIDTFESLEKPLHVVATNLLLGKEKMFDQGELIKPLLASAALTPVFSPVEIDNTLYADGGIMNNFPKEYVNGKTDFVIGSNVSIASELQKKDLKNSLQLAGRVTSLMIYASNHKKLQECDLFIEPSELESIGMLDKKGIEKAFTIGYLDAKRALEEAYAAC
ncbi:MULTISPECIES: patatin-like phospholipase family protein [Flavobacteriaceae]|uniref:patatin-like phospholipase family protein n=1 Tax=Flavobacteriaceae TaxID=49546 RepID=UPI0014923BD8|nr:MULTISPECIES: patatin-like phospholipase family protein [Allomuricauda]MDC6366471.1 patatin-like phospholipase family protein [Muricauda sp. AC10]